MNDESKHDADTMKKHHDFTLKTGPAVMFDMNKILDSETLDIKLIRDEIIESQARTGMSVRFIELEFKSQNWHGFVWKHFTKIFIPSDYSGEGNIGIIGQKWQDFEDGSDRSVIPETGKGTIAEYAEGTALDLDLPIMIFAVPGEDINTCLNRTLPDGPISRCYPPAIIPGSATSRLPSRICGPSPLWVPYLI
mgnify:CR=1 FL=1|jgi:hypothetical protein